MVVNLLSNDVSRFDLLFQFLNFVWITPIQVRNIQPFEKKKKIKTISTLLVFLGRYNRNNHVGQYR